MNAMKKAHEIRKAAAVKFNCAVSEIHFGECLRLAHNSKELEMTAPGTATVSDVAEEIAGQLGGRIWENYGKCRVYVHKNFIAINEDGIDLSGLGRNDFEEMKEAAHKAAEKHGLEVYEIYRGRKIAA